MRNFFLASLITVMSFFLGAAPVQLHCWIVRSANGEADNSVASISNEVAHELGHACGLDDIYESHSGTSLTVSGPPDKLRFTHDWGWGFKLHGNRHPVSE